jgi:hypothetical protein
MKQTEFESKQLRQINEIQRLDEGIGGWILRMLFGKKFEKTMKTAVDAASSDKEIQAALADIKYHHERLEDLLNSNSVEQTAMRRAAGYSAKNKRHR